MLKKRIAEIIGIAILTKSKETFEQLSDRIIQEFIMILPVEKKLTQMSGVWLSKKDVGYNACLADIRKAVEK